MMKYFCDNVWQKLSIIVAVFSFVMLLPFLALAQQTQIVLHSPDESSQRLVDIFSSTQLPSEWFADSSVVAPVNQAKKQIIERLGQPIAIELVASNQYKIIFKEWAMPATIVLDNQKKITTIWFGPPVSLKKQDMVSIQKEFEGLSGNNSLLIIRNGQILIDVKSAEKRAVASAFKLGVLAVLQQLVQQGKLHWDQVIPGISEGQRSLPTGILQDFPENSPITLTTLATLMIFISDNTATDVLIDVLGRSDIEKILDLPVLLKTREIFTLKDPQNADLLQQWRQANTDGQRRLLPQVQQRPLPSVAIFGGGKVLASEVEWFVSNQKLCQLINQVAELPLFTVNPGLADKNDWTKIAYKGGSEPGVLNLTTWLQARNGDVYCVSVTWNDQNPLPEQKYMLWYGLVLKTLAEMSGK